MNGTNSHFPFTDNILFDSNEHVNIKAYNLKEVPCVGKMYHKLYVATV